jgi:hypothetical protein
MVEKLRDEFGPQHIALLTTKSRHPMHKDQVKRDSDSYWKTIWDKQEIFYGTVSGFKGLERKESSIVTNLYTMSCPNPRLS